MQQLEEKTQTQKENGERRTLVNFRLALFCAFFFIFGVYFYKAVILGASLWWLILLCLPFFSLLLFKTKKELFRTFIRVLSLVCAFLFGMGAFALQVRSFESGGKYNGDFFVSGIVDDCLQEGELCKITLSHLEIDGNAEKGKLVAYLPYTYAKKLHLNDSLAMQGKVKRETLDFEDNYFAYTILEDIRFQMNAEEAVVLDNQFRLFPFLREKLITTLREGLDETTASVTIALLTGDSRSIDNGLLDNVRYGGIAHVFAVSGLHVGVLFGISLWLMKRKSLRRTPKIIRFIFVAIVLLLYGGICGYSASVLRATVTCLIAYASQLIGLTTDSGESIGVSALVVTAISPVSIFTVGFQLSFAACFGIVWLSKPILNCLIKPLPVTEEGDTAPLSVWQDTKRRAISFFAVTLSAQIATAPIQMATFGYLSLWSILLNCIFVPLISALFSILLLLVFVGCILPATWTATILYLPNLLWTVLLLAFEIVDFSSFALTGITLNGPAIVCYYLVCTLFTDKYNLSKKTKRILIFLAILAFGITMYALNAV